jgi:hypothetical protein
VHFQYDLFICKAEQAHYQIVCAERDAVRGEINKSTYKSREKEGKYSAIIYKWLEMVEQGMQEIRKLNSIIRIAETEMLLLRNHFSATFEERNSTGMQLIDRNQELVLLYEKYSIQESILRNGDIELKKREEVRTIIDIFKYFRKLEFCSFITTN